MSGPLADRDHRSIRPHVGAGSAKEWATPRRAQPRERTSTTHPGATRHETLRNVGISGITLPCRSICTTSTTPLYSRAEEERELAERVAEGDPSAREHMVKANLRLVVNIARGYLGKGLCLEDLIEEGNLGLMRAVEGFDGAMDTRFSTYASYWIKQSIRRAVMNNGKPIRLPAYMVSLLAKWKRVTDRPDRTAGPAADARGGRPGAAALEEEGGDRRQGDQGQQPDPPHRGRRGRRASRWTTC